MTDLEKAAVTALADAREAQSTYWESLTDLEEALTALAGENIEVDGTEDLEAASVESLLDIEEAEDE